MWFQWIDHFFLGMAGVGAVCSWLKSRSVSKKTDVIHEQIRDKRTESTDDMRNLVNELRRHIRQSERQHNTIYSEMATVAAKLADHIADPRPRR